MPTLLNHNGFKFFFYANEHLPPHVHVIKGDSWAKIELHSLNVVFSSFKKHEFKECMKILFAQQKFFLEKWYEWFNR